MITRENCEEYMMMLADGELSPSETAELKAFVKGDPTLEQELAYWMSARIVPDAREVYTAKEKLLKKAGGTCIIGLQWNRSYGIAAGILLLICLGLFKWQGSNSDNNRIVKNDTLKNFSNPQIENAIPKTTVVAANADTNSKQTPVAHLESKKLKKELVKPQSLKTSVSPDRKDEPIARKEIRNEEPNDKTSTDTGKAIVQKTPVERFERKEETVKRPEQAQLANNPVKEIKETPPAAVIPEDSISAVPKPKKNFFARLPFKGRRNIGVNLVTDAVADKMQKVNKVRENLKNTDITIKIGNKELLAFNL